MPEEAKTTATKKHRSLEPDYLVREQVGGFLNFLRERAVVGLAIGFIIGLQAQTLVKQFVDSFITPLLNWWLGDLTNREFTVYTPHGVSEFTWGRFIYAAVDFLLVVFFVYVTVKLFGLDKLDKKPKKNN